MKLPYKSLSPVAGVTNYEIVDDAIILEFSDGKSRYVYNSVKPGRTHVRAMKKLAQEGKGLSTYINQHVRENYAEKLPLP